MIPPELNFHSQDDQVKKNCIIIDPFLKYWSENAPTYETCLQCDYENEDFDNKHDSMSIRKGKLSIQLI